MNRNGANLCPCSTPAVISKKVCHHQVILPWSECFCKASKCIYDFLLWYLRFQWVYHIGLRYLSSFHALLNQQFLKSL